MSQENPFAMVSCLGRSVRAGADALGPSTESCFVGRQREMAALAHGP
jgi:hypothetical protein